jgi:hypothetical protein
MKDLPRITEIIKIEPFKITCRWTTGEIRVIDFEPEFDKWLKNKNTLLLNLNEFEKFENVTTKDGTLQWYSIEISFKDSKGQQKTEPLDMDPDVLYHLSKPISYYKLILDPSVHKEMVIV